MFEKKPKPAAPAEGAVADLATEKKAGEIGQEEG